MQQQLRIGAITLALLGGISLAAAQGASTQEPSQMSPSSGMSGSTQGKLNLSSSQQQDLQQSLASQPTQSAPASFQAQVGEKIPSSLKAKSLPQTAQTKVPEAKDMVFVKLSDRVLLIDPVNQEIAEIIPLSGSTTGMGAGGSSLNGGSGNDKSDSNSGGSSGSKY